PEYHLQLFDYPSGIRSDAVTAMDKDRKGMLWILYRSLVQRFDGKEVQNFRPSPRVNSLLCDKQGRIWVCAEKEVFLFSERTGTFNAVAVGEPGEGLKVGPVVELPNGEIWLLTNKGFFKFSRNEHAF
ncbi:MAG TPA: two-component regulator propeller domain-containing protein, partial [Agriterribacter sp.]|nr:two-component regulator propeller domain-containing protein [Agriterribacter sp.]